MKVLIVGAKQPEDSSGTNNTIKNIFSFLDSNDILYVSFSDLPKDRKYNLNICHYICAGVYGLMKRYRVKDELPKQSMKPYIQQKLSIKEIVLGIIDLFPIKISAEQYALLDNFEPTYIYTYGTKITNFKLVYKLAKRYKIPIGVHVMDNWYDITYTSGGMRFFRKILEYYVSKVINCGKIHFTISKPLSERMRKSYPEILWQELFNPATEIVKCDLPKIEKTIGVLYAGGITLNRWKSLLDIGDVIRRLNDENIRQDINFEVYVSKNSLESYEAKKLRKANITVREYVPANEVYELYRRFDILILVESFDRELSTFLEFSLSTKVPEYLASNRLVLAYMPSNLYTVEFLRKQKLGVVCTNKKELFNFFSEFNIDEYGTYIENQIEFVEKELSLQAIQKKLFNAMV